VSDPLADLVKCSQRGDAKAFARLVAETQGGVYNLAYNVLRNHEDAQDATQEVYLRVWRALPGFRAESKFTTWLYRLAINACLNRRRQLRTQLHVVDSEEVLQRVAAPGSDPMAVTLDSERAARLWAAVDHLPEKYRLVIGLFYQEQRSYQEIAEMLALPVGTVKAHLNRARAALARSLRQRGESEDASL
jgi:RNA polymerase sigma-70 factor (ECF subfamily)